MTTGLGLARVTMRLGPGEGADVAVLDIADHGPPPTATLLEVFEHPFDVTGQNRTGALGLALAQEIVREHHGTLTIEEGLGGGTVRRVIFPVAAK